jgi:hypothetical protein
MTIHEEWALNSIPVINTYASLCRYYLEELEMLKTIDYENTEKNRLLEKFLKRYNRIWGAEYMLMDSKTFMGRLGGISGEEYDKIIELFMRCQSPFTG